MITKNLSVALAVYNEKTDLPLCLESVKDIADEIVIVDGGSTDETVAIAKSFGAKTYTFDNPPVFHINKQRAVDKCTGIWILQLDADEVLPKVLQEEIRVVVDSSIKSTKYLGYYVPRKNYFLHHWMRKTAMYPDAVVRLFIRGKGYFPKKSVHEQIVIDGPIGYLKNELLHYPYKTFGEYWEKALRYSLLVARELKARKEPLTPVFIFNYNIIKPIKTFFNLFIRHKGFMDGIYGFLFSFFSALQHPIALIQYIYGKNFD